MSKGIAHGSADGPRMIYGRENVNWAGPQRASDNNMNSNPMSDYAQNNHSGMSLQSQIDELVQLYPDDYVLQHYNTPSDRRAIHQELIALRKAHPQEAADYVASPIRSGKISVMNGANKKISFSNDIGDVKWFYSNSRTYSYLNSVHDSFKSHLANEYNAALENGDKKTADKLAQYHNDVDGDKNDVFVMINHCADIVKNNRFGDDKAEREVLNSFMSAVRVGRYEPYRDKTNWTFSEFDQAFKNIKEKNDSLVGFSIPDKFKDKTDNLWNMQYVMDYIKNLPEETQQEVREMFNNFAKNMEIIAPMYGDNPQLDAQLDEIIEKSFDQFENDFYYETLVKDHVQAHNIAMQYGVESIADNMEEGDYKLLAECLSSMSNIGIDGEGSAKMIAGNIMGKEKPSYTDVYSVSSQFKKAQSATATIDSRKMSTQSIDDYFYATPLGSSQDHHKGKKLVKELKDIQHKSANRLVYLGKKTSPPIQVEQIVGTDPATVPYRIIERAYFSQKPGNNEEDWNNYDMFMQEVKKLNAIPTTGVKSQIQKSAIMYSMYKDLFNTRLQ